MQLSRRDAIAALAAIGAGGAAAGGAARLRSDRDGGDDGDIPKNATVDSDPSFDDAELADAFVAVAEVVYPSEVTGLEEFVRSFLGGRLDRGSHAEPLRATASQLDRRAEEWYDDRIVALPVADRDRLLREVGADTADEVPDGTLAERVRYYVVNELLLALYASPTGGELVGIENPQGHPGGRDTYQRGPNR
ncbi:gluconate 2-dehydrogenase subunit 3 family protein [Halopenitus sp. H-Gu1]|uniref:gluconate 2-dehydrogenase subunit 3 family protein n=1 Tax=Halopenitus sp. H-Gu1 TaxID=3242697 RepID=UPI00359DBA07